MMLLDWTQYSRFVSNQVRDRCKKGAKETGQPARNLGEVAKPYGSMNFSNIPTSTNRGSLGSLSKQHVAESGTAAGSSMESGLDVGDQEVHTIDRQHILFPLHDCAIEDYAKILSFKN